MKSKLSIGVCVLLSLALVLFGLLYGTVGGFAEDRKQVTALLWGENGLMDALSYRGADGLNLCVVAERHLQGDEDVAALRKVAMELAAGKASLARTKKANAELDAAASAVAAKLNQSPGFLASERDQKYLSMLESDMQNLAQKASNMKYDDAAREFNERLNGTPLGAVAKLCKVLPCELYE